MKLKALFVIYIFLLFWILPFQEIKNSNFERAPSSVKILNQQNLNSPCQLDIHCKEEYVCKKGWCRTPNLLGEANDYCSDHKDCRSQQCNLMKCQPTFEIGLDNGELCNPQLPTLCRSNKCIFFDSKNTCQGSYRFKAFPNNYCDYDSDCLSSNCVEKICKTSNDFLNCASIGESCKHNSNACCSGNCVNNFCEAKSNSECTLLGDCKYAVGKICVDDGKPARNSTQCCSGKIMNGICRSDFSKAFIPCTKDYQCRDGKCNLRTNLCEY